MADTIDRLAVLVDLYCGATTFHWWSWPGVLNYESVAYQDGFQRFTFQTSLKATQGLGSNPFSFVLDGSALSDNEDLIGAWWDSDWHLKPVRVRKVRLSGNPASGVVTVLGVRRTYWGTQDERQRVTADDIPTTVELTCTAGVFKVRGRNLRTRTHADQQLRSPGDLFYKNTAAKVGVVPPWGRNDGDIPGSGRSASIPTGYRTKNGTYR